MALSHELVVSYKLQFPSRRLTRLFSRNQHPKEADLYEAISRAAGGDADSFSYDRPQKRRKLSWLFRSSREARAAEGHIRMLRRKFPTSGLRTKVVVSRYESLEETRKRYSITPGQYKRLMREGSARQCEECHHCLPKYHGRYPKDCPECGGKVGMPISEEETKEKPKRRIKHIVKQGVKAGAVTGAALGALAGAGFGGSVAGVPGALTGAALGALEGGVKGGAIGGLGTAAVTGGFRTKHKYHKKKNKLRDSLESLINGRPLSYVIDGLLQDKYDGSSTHSSQNVD